MRKPTVLELREGRRCRGRRTTQAPCGSAGVVASACIERMPNVTREASTVKACDLQPDSREGQAGPCEVAERPVVALKPGNSGGAKGPQFRENARRSEGFYGDWRRAYQPHKGSRASGGVACESEGIARLSFLHAVRQDLPEGRALASVLALPCQRWCRGRRPA